MPYHKISLAKLSKAQIMKLLKGERVRVKHGNAHQIHVSEEQHRKIMSAHRKGKGCTIQCDPYQQELNGGSFGSFLRKAGHALAPIGHAIAPIAKEIAHKGVDLGVQYLKDRSGVGLHHAHHAHHLHHSHHAHHEHGDGLFGNLLNKAKSEAMKHALPIGKKLLQQGIDYGSNYVKNKIGTGAKKRAVAAKRRGRGIDSGYDSEDGGALFPAGY